MSEPYIAEIKMFAGNFAPRGYAFCNGQMMAISQNTALFALLGVNYGGDGRVTFALPDLQGRAPMFWGQGPGLTQRFIGEQSGEANVTLLSTEMPAHNHLLQCNVGGGALNNPQAATFGAALRGSPPFYTGQPTQQQTVPMAPQALGISGGSQPHNNMQPYQAVSFIIALQGVFPPRN